MCRSIFTPEHNWNNQTGARHIKLLKQKTWFSKTVLNKTTCFQVQLNKLMPINFDYITQSRDFMHD